MEREWTQERIQSYIDDQIEENFQLDYKSGEAVSRDKTDDITKDVSAFANSAGGLIIYGVCEFKEKEKRHLPERITPIERSRFSKEWLAQIINNIRPHVSAIIHPVPLSHFEGAVAYVVEILPGTTAHQCTDCRYYRRYNFESVPMLDHEVRDVMRRKTHPILTTTLTIIHGIHWLNNRVVWRVTNESDVMARSVCTVIRIPVTLNGRSIYFKDCDMRSDSEGFTSYILRASNFRDGPLFPRSEFGQDFVFEVRDFTHLAGAEIKGADVVKYKTYADEMPFVSGILPVTDILKVNGIFF